MAEAADNLSLLELDESVGQEDIVGVSFEDAFLPLSTLAGQTTGSLEFYSENEPSARTVTDRPLDWKPLGDTGEIDEQTDIYIPEDCDLRHRVENLKRCGTVIKFTDSDTAKKPRLDTSKDGEGEGSKIEIKEDDSFVALDEIAEDSDLPLDLSGSQSVGLQGGLEDLDSDSDHSGDQRQV